jgi:Bacterial SH3 domain
MRRVLGGVVLAVLATASVGAARTATVKDRARLRAGPSATSELRVWLPGGTQVELLSESAGWYEVQSSLGTGFIWGEHLAMETPPARAEAPAPASVLDEVRALREEVRTLSERPAPATAADVERLRVDVERALGGGRESGHADGPGAPLVSHEATPESLLSFAPVLLLIGGAVGWITSRLFQRGRDRRQRNRLRL